MKILKAEFMTSAADSYGYPPEAGPEIAFVGRSNVGKSSLINAFLGRKAIAKVSSSPGKTRTINFFGINDEFRIVDLPGYGFARVSKAERESWGEMIEAYLMKRQTLAGVVQLVDSRHEPSAQDIQMYEWLRYYGLSGIVVATKSDKLSRNLLGKQMSLIRKTLKLDESDVLIAFSSINRSGLEELGSEMEKLIERYKEGK